MADNSACSINVGTQQLFRSYKKKKLQFNNLKFSGYVKEEIFTLLVELNQLNRRIKGMRDT